MIVFKAVRRAWFDFTFGILVALCASALFAEPPNDDEIVRAFVEASDKRTDLTDEQKTRLKAAVTKARESADSRDSALIAGLEVIAPDLRKAIDGLASDDPAAARQTLEVFTEELNVYLAAAATDLLGRHLADRGRAVDALPLLLNATEKYSAQLLALDRTLLARARVEAKLLKRDDATTTLRRVLRDAASLSAERKQEIEQQIAELEAIEPGSLDDVRDRMKFSRGQLAEAETGEPVRAEQKQIVAMLDKLIEDAEQRESQGQGKGKGKKSGKGQGQGAGSGKPGSGAGEGPGKGSDDPTQGPAVRKLTRGGPQSPWGQLRDKERDPAFSAIKEKLPARYQQLIEQYYKSFQEDQQ